MVVSLTERKTTKKETKTNAVKQTGLKCFLCGSLAKKNQNKYHEAGHGPHVVILFESRTTTTKKTKRLEANQPQVIGSIEGAKKGEVIHSPRGIVFLTLKKPPPEGPKRS